MHGTIILKYKKIKAVQLINSVPPGSPTDLEEENKGLLCLL